MLVALPGINGAPEWSPDGRSMAAVCLKMVSQISTAIDIGSSIEPPDL